MEAGSHESVTPKVLAVLQPPRSANHLMRFAIYGLLFAALVFLISGGHFLFLPLIFLLPLGGMFGHRRRHGHFWYRTRRY
jgi:hypothetical protein